MRFLDTDDHGVVPCFIRRVLFDLIRLLLKSLSNLMYHSNSKSILTLGLGSDDKHIAP